MLRNEKAEEMLAAREPLTEPQRTLVAEYYPKLRTAVKTWVGQRRWSLELDELVAEGCLGVINAARSYDPSRGVKFSTYASRFAIGRCIDFVRRRAQEVPHIQVEDAWLDPTLVYKPAEPIEFKVTELLGCLEQRTSEVARLRLVEDLTLKEIGRVMGFHETVACRLFIEARKKLRDELLKRGIQGEIGAIPPSSLDGEFQHGLNSTYSFRGCRCQPCRDAHLTAGRLYAERKNRKRRMDRAKARELVPA